MSIGEKKMNKTRLLFAAILSVAVLIFQMPAWADANADKARALVQEAADLTKQAADLTKEENSANVLKVNDLLKEAEGKMADARRIGSESAELTGEQKAGLVGHGNTDKDGVDDPSHPGNLAEATQNPVASLISVPLERISILALDPRTTFSTC